MVMSVTPTVCITLAFWLGRGARTCACAGREAAQAARTSAAAAARGRNLRRVFILNFSSLRLMPESCLLSSPGDVRGGLPRKQRVAAHGNKKTARSLERAV